MTMPVRILFAADFVCWRDIFLGGNAMNMTDMSSLTAGGFIIVIVILLAILALAVVLILKGKGNNSEAPSVHTSVHAAGKGFQAFQFGDVHTKEDSKKEGSGYR